MESEIREVVYISITAFLVSIVLSFASYMISIQRDLAEVRTNDIVSNRNVEEYRKFNKYENKYVSGNEVIECIRMYYDSGIDIFVSNITNTMITDAGGIVQAGMDARIFSNDEYAVSKTKFEVDKLMKWLTSSDKYYARLVYDSEDVVVAYNNTVVGNKYNKSTASSEVTGIIFIKTN